MVIERYKDRKNLKQSALVKLHDIIFEADSFKGKLFDIVLMGSILLSVLIVIIDSVPSYHLHYGEVFFTIELVLTILFTIEYVLRIISVGKPFKYIFSFYGLIDFISIIPTYLLLFFGGLGYLAILRALRLLRIFRVLKLARYIRAVSLLVQSLNSSKYRIMVFFFTVIIIVTILGSFMYVIEGAESGFTSIPISIYWAIVTLTTVGYGDIAPLTSLGQAFASFIMILGYAIIAVPAGIISIEMSKNHQIITNTQSCHNCHKSMHDDDAKFCKYCGYPLDT
jgi:voltage-gated potassium channel